MPKGYKLSLQLVLAPGTRQAISKLLHDHRPQIYKERRRRPARLSCQFREEVLI